MDLKKTGRLIRKRRKEHNLTQEQLSEKLFVTPQAVSLWENGQRYPDSVAQVKLLEVLGLDPVELITGLPIYDDELKQKIRSHMSRMDEQPCVAGMAVDEDGFEEYIDFSDAYIVTNDKYGNASDKWIPYVDYHNIEKAPKAKNEPKVPKDEYDPTKIYLNHYSCILVIPVELLAQIGFPKFFSIRWNEKKLSILIVAEDKMTKDFFDIPDKVYSGKWKGIHVLEGKFGPMILKLMGIKKRNQLLEVTPYVDSEHGTIEILLDEVKRSNADVDYSKFLLPQWQYDMVMEDDDEVDDDEE